MGILIEDKVQTVAALHIRSDNSGIYINHSDRFIWGEAYGDLIDDVVWIKKRLRRGTIIATESGRKSFVDPTGGHNIERSCSKVGTKKRTAVHSTILAVCLSEQLKIVVVGVEFYPRNLDIPTRTRSDGGTWDTARPAIAARRRSPIPIRQLDRTLIQRAVRIK